jgi:hypothetical protein
MSGIDDPPVSDLQNTIGLVRQEGAMSRDKHGAARAPSLGQEFEDMALGVGIDLASGLVADEDVGIGRERDGEPSSRRLAAGELRG